jgi:hypothetical protein
MTDRLSKSEVEVLREEVDELHVVVEEVSRVERIVSSTPWTVRLWRRLFGRLVYDGPETCGHCKYWKPPLLKPRKTYHSRTGKEQMLYYNGDCKLLFGEDDTIERDTCTRFAPRRRYKHRVRG